MRKKKLITAKIKRALDNDLTIFWLRRGKWAELHAVTYTWENGKSRTAKLAEYYLSEEESYLLVFDIAIAVEDYQPSHSQCSRNIESALKDAWYEAGVIPIQERPDETYKARREMHKIDTGESE